jgi:hypothetical protein
VPVAPKQQKDRFIFIMEIVIYLKVCMKAVNKRSTASMFIALLVELSALWTCVTVCALDSQTSPIVEKKQLEAMGAAGLAVIDREYHFFADGSLRVGVASGIEIGSPAALAVRLSGSQAGGVMLGVGIVDLYVSSDGRLLFEPMLMIGGHARFGPEASLRAAVDIVGAEEGIQRGDHAFWLRGSLGLIVDFGRVATLAFGVAYQRVLVDGTHPDELSKIGWASDSRVSLGSVRTQPFSDLPLFSIHMQESLDFIVITRFDVNTADRTSDIRCLIGFSLFLVPRAGS